MIKIQSVLDKAFAPYGKVLEGYDFAPMLSTLREVSEKPADSVIYVPSEKALESLDIYKELEQNLYGAMPIQIGYCNGNNRLLNCLEYHRGSEINVAADDVILLLAKLADVSDGKISTQKVEAFLLPRGQAILLYETSLHYAPCTSPDNEGFRVVIILPKGTNMEKTAISVKNTEDKLLWGANKWLIAHPDSPEAKQGAWVGLEGENIRV